MDIIHVVLWLWGQDPVSRASKGWKDFSFWDPVGLLSSEWMNENEFNGIVPPNKKNHFILAHIRTGIFLYFCLVCYSASYWNWTACFESQVASENVNSLWNPWVQLFVCENATLVVKLNHFFTLSSPDVLEKLPAELSAEWKDFFVEGIYNLMLPLPVSVTGVSVELLWCTLSVSKSSSRGQEPKLIDPIPLAPSSARNTLILHDIKQ